MCEFCHTHGEGKTWYLRAKNYSDDLLSDLDRRKFIGEFFETLPARYPGMVRGAERLQRAPAFVRKTVRRTLLRKQKADHFGQVLPIEDVERIMGFVTSVVRLACVCRKVTVGSEHRSCYGLSLGPGEAEMFKILKGAGSDYLIGPETKGLEPLTPAAALAAFKEHEKQGLCHTVWTFKAPFTGGLCNCDGTDCLAMKFQLGSGIATFFRAEYVAGVDHDLCNGCRACLRLCPFGAMMYSSARRRVTIDPKRCYGCGICRSACAEGAISLAPRASVPAARELWL
jgi:ferredoxin